MNRFILEGFRWSDGELIVFRIFDFAFLAAGASRCWIGRQIVGRHAEDDGGQSGHGRRQSEGGRFEERIVDGAAVEESAAVLEGLDSTDPRLGVWILDMLIFIRRNEIGLAVDFLILI